MDGWIVGLSNHKTIEPFNHKTNIRQTVKLISGVNTVDAKNIEKLLKRVKAGKIGIDEAMNELRFLPFEDLGFAKIDTHRALRKGFPEVILCPGKSIEQI